MSNVNKPQQIARDSVRRTTDSTRSTEVSKARPSAPRPPAVKK